MGRIETTSEGPIKITSEIFVKVDFSWLPASSKVSLKDDDLWKTARKIRTARMGGLFLQEMAVVAALGISSLSMSILLYGSI